MISLIKTLFFSCLLSSACFATQTSLFWTNCITDVLSTGRGNINVDNYFTVFNRPGRGSSLPTDVGFQLGLLTINDFALEAGFDYFGGTSYPVFFNCKWGILENKFARKSPSFSIGIYNVGTKLTGPLRTNQNIIDIVIGKTLPKWIGGRLFLGFYSGSSAMGGPNRQGFMVGYLAYFCPAIDCQDISYFKWALAADYASGRNIVGGGGVGVTYYFNHNVSIETGPTWFNSFEINGAWKWSVQVDINLAVFTPVTRRFVRCR